MPYEAKKLGELLLFNASLIVGMFILTRAPFIQPTLSFASHLNVRPYQAFYFKREWPNTISSKQNEQGTPDGSCIRFPKPAA